MDRRAFLASLLATGASAAVAESGGPGRQPVYSGWLDRPEVRELPHPGTRQLAGDIGQTGQGKVVLLWRALELATGHAFVPRVQKGNDCCGQAAALGVDILTAIQGTWRGPHCSEPIYAGSRNEIFCDRYGGHICRGRCRNGLGSQGGSTGAWVAEWLRDYGALLRDQYGEYDLTNYSYRLTKAWADTGVPDQLETKSKPHRVQCTRIDGGWLQVCDLVSNGYPVMVCSQQGFVNLMDDDGFCRPSQDSWYHAMLIVGVDTDSKRQGGCFAQSWPQAWLKKVQPHKYGTPTSGFWADADVIDSMVNLGDSYAFSDISGYRRRNLDYLLG